MKNKVKRVFSLRNVFIALMLVICVLFGSFLGACKGPSTPTTPSTPPTPPVEPSVAQGDTQMIMLGTSALAGYDATKGYTYLYYGNHSWQGTTDSVMWRVLDDKTNTDEDGFFLLSEKALKTSVYDGTQANHTAQYWDSDVRAELESLANSMFTAGELSTVIATSKDDAEYTVDGSTFAAIGGTKEGEGIEGILNNDKLFLLSAEEADNADYGFIDATSKVAAGWTGGKASWWLRSSYVFNQYPSTDAVGYVASGLASSLSAGTISNYRVWHTGHAIRPAFNLSGDNILFTLAVNESALTQSSLGLIAIPEYTGSTYKATILDDSRNFAVTDNSVTVDGTDFNFAYTGATVGANEYVSVMILDANGAVLYYGHVATGSEAGTAQFAIPTGLNDGTYTMKVFSEQINQGNSSNYASALVNCSVTIG